MNGRVYELRFDGSCNPNPGGIARCAWAVYVHDPEEHDGPVVIAQGHRPVFASGGEQTTNNIAEWHGLLEGLEWFRCLRLATERLMIRGDSRLVIHQLTGRMKCKKPHLESRMTHCRGILSTFRFPWEAEWIPREENAHCDRLAAGLDAEALT